MKRDDVFNSKYLKAADLHGKPITVTIESVSHETLKNPVLPAPEPPKVVQLPTGS